MADNGSPVVEGPTQDPRRAKRSRRQISLRRLVVLLLALGALGAGTTRVVQNAVAPGDAGTTWFAPYVDLTLTPSFDFQEPSVSTAKNVVLAFVVGSAADKCTPSWGQAYSLDEAATALDLDRRIAALRSRGGQIIVSFGGVINTELSKGCTDETALLAAYRGVVARYDAPVIDLDIEGADLRDGAASVRRARAIAALQSERRGAGHPLDVWLTVPVTPDGMLSDARAALDEMLAAKVDLAGVNIMTMDYGGSKPSRTDMATASISAIDATLPQIAASYAAAGIDLGRAGPASRLGVTPMIGQNDIAGERLDLGQTRRLVGQARARGVRRLSFWSLNRDRQCPGNVATDVAQNNCSGVNQDPLEFVQVFGSTSASVLESQATTTSAPRDVRATATATDDPATSPYPIWRPRREYPAESKVVWRRQVYVAKWWNVGTQPDAPVEHPWDSPWQRVGPVLDTDTPPTTAPPLKAGTYPAWDHTKSYKRADTVQVDGRAYRAKWRTQGDDPTADVDNVWQSPWEPVKASEAPPTTVPPLATGTYPAWDVTKTYKAGDVVQVGGRAYRAKWMIQGTSPTAPVDEDWQSPWESI